MHIAFHVHQQIWPIKWRQGYNHRSPHANLFFVNEILFRTARQKREIGAQKRRRTRLGKSAQSFSGARKRHCSGLYRSIIGWNVCQNECNNPRWTCRGQYSSSFPGVWLVFCWRFLNSPLEEKVTSYPAEPAPTFIFRQDEVWRLREQLLNASHLDTRVVTAWWRSDDAGWDRCFFFFWRKIWVCNLPDEMAEMCATRANRSCHLEHCFAGWNKPNPPMNESRRRKQKIIVTNWPKVHRSTYSRWAAVTYKDETVLTREVPPLGANARATRQEAVVRNKAIQ